MRAGPPRFIRFALLFAGVIGLAGCATQAQRAMQDMNAKIEQTNRQYEKCGDESLKTPSVVRLTDKVIFDARDYDFRLLIIEEFASENDIADLLQLYADYQPCRRQFLEGLGRAHPAFMSLMVKLYAESDENLLRLVKGELSFGEANKRGVDLYSRYLIRWNETGIAITKNLDVSHRYEIQQRQVAGAALRQWVYQQQLLNSLNQAPRTTFTNCSFIGNQVHCTSY